MNAPRASGISRRHFIGTMAAALPMLAVPSRILAEAAQSRTLAFNHLHTGERLGVEYFSGGEYVPGALSAINRLLRDFRTGDVHPIDPGLLDLLHGLTGLTGSRRPFEVISGFRSPVTNATLRQRSEGVAAGSLHMKGLAIDIRIEDVPLAKLRSAALAVRRGGVGYYPASNFVHVDTGRIRAW